MPGRRVERLADDAPNAAERSPDLAAGRRRRIRGRLIAWYDRSKRDLPWRRRSGDPYAQLLAEFMLQQTQVATVVPYFERFIARFPGVGDLAAAGLDEVLALWSGLGYYARARNLHAAAKQIVERFGGIVPREVHELRSLPGIGRYTAGAIASVAYGVRAPVLDGNVIRVLTRVLGIEEDPKRPSVRERLWANAGALLPRSGCGDFNQALMELGATVCLPRSPQCPACPVHSHCRAFRDRMTDRIPFTGQRARVEALRTVVAALRRKDGATLFVRRPAKGLWGGLWELPGEDVGDGETLEAARRRLAGRLRPVGKIERSPMGEVTRSLSHRRITFTVFPGYAVGRPRINRLGEQPARWVQPGDAEGLGISRACQAVLARAGVVF